MKFREVFQSTKHIAGPRIPRRALFMAWLRYKLSGARCGYCGREIGENSFYVYFGLRRAQGWYCNQDHACAEVSGQLGTPHHYEWYTN